MRGLGRTAALAAVMMAPGLALRAQDAPPAAATPPAVGEMAPDFTLPGATAAGPSGALRLSDFRGKTVVLAFFFQARTKG